MTWSTILEDILPTKWSRYIAVLTMLSAISASRLPLYWPLSKLVTTNTEIQLFQVLLSVSTVLIGALCCLTLVIVDYHKKNKEYKANLDAQHKRIESTPIGTETAAMSYHVNNPLDDMQVNILLFLFKQPNLTPETISKSLKTDLEAINFHLQELYDLKMVYTDIRGDYPKYQVWFLAQEGRRYLIKHKLIS